jgi:hypothetical protein
MIRDRQLLEEFERRYQMEAYEDLTYPEALSRYEAMWVLAREIDPELGCDWEDDLAPDLAVARAVNGLPPAD